MTERIKYMDVKEFVDLGYLQELNRRFLHPLGLALAVTTHDDGTEELACVYDARDDPEGYCFSYQPDTNYGPQSPDEAFQQQQDRAAWVDEEWERRRSTREAALGYMVQPADDRGPLRSDS